MSRGLGIALKETAGVPDTADGYESLQTTILMAGGSRG